MIAVRPVAYVVGLLLCVLAAAMLVPAAADGVAGNPDWLVFVASSGGVAFVGVALVLGMRSTEPIQLGLREAFLLTTVAWAALSAASAIPFLGLALDYTDAFFEAISGLTTTGSTVLVDLDHLPPGVLLWRSLLQWVGGVGIIVMAIVMLPFLRVGGMALFRTESSDQTERVVPQPVRMVSFIGLIYAGLSSACAVAYRLAGMSWFDAVNHAMTTVSTGGYSTYDASFAAFPNPAAQWAAVVFMISGALPFAAYIRAVRGAPMVLLRDPQIRLLFWLLVAVSGLMAVWLAAFQGIPFLDAVRLTAFNVTSIVTTTGYATADYMHWGAPAVGVFLILIVVGGCAGSTAGGIKMYRHHLLALAVIGQLRRLFSPHRVVVLSYDGRRVPDDVPVSILAFLSLFLAAIGVATVALAAMGLDLVTALSAAAQAMANVGPGLGAIVGPAGNYATIPDGAKWVLSAAMLLGRLEIFTVLVLLVPGFWRD